MSGGSNIVDPGDRQLPLSCAKLSATEHQPDLKTPSLRIQNSGITHAWPLPKSAWQIGLHTKVEVWWDYLESRDTSPIEPGQKFHCIRGGLSFSKNVSSFSGLLSFLSILLTKYKRGSIFLFAIDVNPQLSFNTIPPQGYLQFSRKALKPANHLGPKMRQSKANYGKMRKKIREQKSPSRDHTENQDWLPQIKETGKQGFFCCLLNTDL